VTGKVTAGLVKSSSTLLSGLWSLDSPGFGAWGSRSAASRHCL